MTRRILAVVGGLLVIVLLGGWGQEQHPQHAGQPQAAQAIRAMTTGAADAETLIPADFPAVMGYRPITVDEGGRLEPTRADGSCSSPFGGTVYHFTSECKQHDLGYDLLRYASRKGQPLGPWARRAVDSWFAAQTRQTCHRVGCGAMAALYVGVVRFNSWRQGHGAPAFEPLGRLIAPVLGGLGAALLLSLLPARSLIGNLRSAYRGYARRRRLRIHHPFRWLAATAMLALVLQPALLPHTEWVQSLIGGLCAAQGYAMATLIGRIGLPRRLTTRFSAGEPFPQLRFGDIARLGSTGLVLLAMGSAHHAQTAAAKRIMVPAPPLLDDALAVAGAVLIALVLVAIAGFTAEAARVVVRRLRRSNWRTMVLVLVPALALTGCAVPARAAGQSGRPNAPVNSSLGTNGMKFMDSTPTAAAISAATGGQAQTPIRVYLELKIASNSAGSNSAGSTFAVRAEMATAELDRRGGFSRGAVLIDVPTGSGWVDPAGVRSLEYLTHGDLATVVLPYADSPSWLAYLRGGDGVRASTRALTDAVAARIAELPAGRRPRLLIFGESLGAWGGLRAYPNEGLGKGIDRRTDGALWVGVPGGVPSRPATGTRILIHTDDPVAAWSPGLMLHPTSAWPKHWLPMVSFWQDTADTIDAEHTPSGFGHRYGQELIAAWREILAQPLRTVRYDDLTRDG